MTPLPTNRRPTHPGEILALDFLEPLGMTITVASTCLGISRPRLSEIVNARRSVTPDTAVRLAKFLGTSAEVWMGLQADYDLWGAMYGPDATDVSGVEPAPGAAA